MKRWFLLINKVLTAPQTMMGPITAGRGVSVPATLRPEMFGGIIAEGPWSLTADSPCDWRALGGLGADIRILDKS